MAFPPSDLVLQPGELELLLASRRLQLSSSAVIGVPASGGERGVPRSVHEVEAAAAASGIDALTMNRMLQCLAIPEVSLQGVRGARRREPWPYTVSVLGPDAALMAPEPDGSLRLRYPYTRPAMIRWLAGPFEKFARPEMVCTDFPPLAADGIAVLLALVDLFRSRYPDLDPDWRSEEPVAFTIEEVHRVLDAGISGEDFSSLVLGLSRLGAFSRMPIEREAVEGLLYVFVNEGYLASEPSSSPAIFTMTEAFLGVALSLAWWDLSFVVGKPGGPMHRFLQGLAVWQFITETDGRLRMQATDGNAILDLVNASIPASADPVRVADEPRAMTARFCGRCGRGVPPGARFCGGCGSAL